MDVMIPLRREAIGPLNRQLVRAGPQTALAADAHRLDNGIEIVRLSNHEGWVDVLPFMGGMVWDACFLGVRLGMRGHFRSPRPASGILGTYGCLLYHAGLLRNGCPGPEDTHPLHGEMPCAAMDEAALQVGQDEAGPYLRLTSTRDHAEGFGPHYRAVPSVTIRPGQTEFEVGMEVRNLAARPMDLMYMVHANFTFPPGARIRQPAPWTPEHVRVRTAVPGHVHPPPGFLERLDLLAREPGRLERLDPALCDPEQVFYLHGLGVDGGGWSHLGLEQEDGTGFTLSYRPAEFPHLVRWLLHTADEQVAGFALPATCEPEGYEAERRKGNVQSLPPGETRRFTVRLGWLDRSAMAARVRTIAESSRP